MMFATFDHRQSPNLEVLNTSMSVRILIERNGEDNM
jgi:hypothetical protein